MSVFRALTIEEHAAVKDYATRQLAKNPKADWKIMLREEWTDGTTLGVLQSLRGSHGPEWLHAYSLTDQPISQTACNLDVSSHRQNSAGFT